MREGKSIGVRFPRRGAATLRVKFLVKIGGDVTARQVAFAIPPALSSKVVLTIDEPEAAVDFPTAVSFKTATNVAASVSEWSGQREKDQTGSPLAHARSYVGTRIETVIGSGERVEVRWTPRVKRAAEMAATEIGKPMTVQFTASSTRKLGWPMRIGLSAVGLVALWLVVNLTLARRRSA